MKDEDMPTREDGLTAEVIVDPSPMFHRMTFGQGYELLFTTACADVTRRLCRGLGFIPTSDHQDFENRPTITMEDLFNVPNELFDENYDYLMKFYQVFNDLMVNKFAHLEKADKVEHLCDIFSEGIIRLFIPVNNVKSPAQIATELKAKFNPTRTKVKYRGASGHIVETIKDVRIGYVYMFLLDKIAAEWSATSNAKLQHFGILTSITRSEKFSYPFRNSPTRNVGETEGRLYICYAGEETMAEMFDRTNSLVTRRNIYWNLLASANPSKIETIVDRTKIPLGSSRPIQITNHICMCAGFKPVYEPEIMDMLEECLETNNDSL